MKNSYSQVLLSLNNQELTAIIGEKPTKSSLLSFTMTVLEKGLAHFMYTESESKNPVFSPNVVHRSPQHSESSELDIGMTPKTERH